MDERTSTGPEHAPPRVSVVVPTHNRGDQLRENLDSVLSQDYDRFEAIYVDDSSVDDTPAILEEYRRAHRDRMRVVRVEHGAPGLARNAGARVAQGEFLLFTDDDCIVPSDWIACMLDCYRRRGCDVLSGGFKPYSMHTRAEQYAHYRLTLIFGDRAKWLTAVPMMNVLLPRALFEKVGGFTDIPMEALEDWEICHRLTASGATIFYDPGVSVIHRYPSQWEGVEKRTKATAVLGVDLYRLTGRSVAKLLLMDTLKVMASPIWLLKYYPLHLYRDALRLRTKLYLFRLARALRRSPGNSG